MKTLLSALTAAWLVLPACAEDAKASDFIRVDEDAQAARLQTGVTHYEKGGIQVDLIGAIHIADAAYYKTLGEKFGTYDAVLFEMVGEDDAAARKEGGEDKKRPDLGGLHKVYGMVAKMLGLTGQMECVDYTRKNFVHADITLDEFKRLQKEKGESIFDLASKNQGKEPDSTKLMQAMLSGNSNRMKLEIIHSLGGVDDQIAGFAGKSVIIGDRNAKCMSVLDGQLEKGRKNLGIFYGAAHFPDMEKRLLEKGFKKTRHEWITAWDVPKPKEAKVVPAPQTVPAPPVVPAVPPSPAVKKAA